MYFTTSFFYWISQLYRNGIPFRVSLVDRIKGCYNKVGSKKKLFKFSGFDIKRSSLLCFRFWLKRQNRRSKAHFWTRALAAMNKRIEIWRARVRVVELYIRTCLIHTLWILIRQLLRVRGGCSCYIIATAVEITIPYRMLTLQTLLKLSIIVVNYDSFLEFCRFW